MATVMAGERTYRVEIAADGPSRAKGLMFRAAMDADAGMLFLFEQDSGHSFWMKNTYIPLDILFYDDQGQLVNAVENAVPQSLELRDGRGSSVLELNAGEFAEHAADLAQIAFFTDGQGGCSDAQWAAMQAHPIFAKEAALVE